MNDETVATIHWSFWVISIAALVWNVLASVNYFMQMNPDIVASFPETHRAIIIGRPAWATGGFAVAVFGGSLGCLLLLLRKPVAFYFLVASLLGVIVTMVHTVDIARSTIKFSALEIFVMILMPLLLAIFLVWYSKQAESNDWIS